MAYSDFTNRTVRTAFGLTIATAPLFEDAPAAAVPPWLPDLIERGMRQPYHSEKARSEIFVWPVLLACRDLIPGPLAIFSGTTLDVDPTLGLNGECAYLLAKSRSTTDVTAPLVAVVEAKREDIQAGVAQCIAQLVGAQRYNRQDGLETPVLHGCVITGEVWQFLRLAGTDVTVAAKRLLRDDLPGILGTFVAMLASTDTSPIDH